tara:strand:- start:194 stop:610 length:417 start_codon:yes stop_codon:yes gene_type:complete
MRSSVYSLMFVSQLFLAAAYGQEQTPLVIRSDNSESVSNKNRVNITRTPASHSGPAYQRMSVSQKLIQQRAFLQAKDRIARINARKAMGITPGRPTVNINVSPIPTYAQIMQQSAGFYYNPYHYSGYWYGPGGYEFGQ